MDIYEQKSRWKIYLAIAGVIILTISMFYTNYLAQRLADGERDKARLLAQAWESLNTGDAGDNADLTFQLEIIKSNTDIPAIVVNTAGKIDYAKNFGDKDEDLEFLEKELDKIKISGPEPIIIPDNYTIYYKKSQLLTLLTYFPLLQVLLFGTFMTIGYFLFSSARRSEQNRVWVGMAKETAHQLGTPISAIVAWIEHLKIMTDDPNIHEVVKELGNDVDRLDLIADRFSKIGSSPDLEAVNIMHELEECRVYMQRRAPRKVAFEFPDPNSVERMVNINPPLFAWVVENLLRNALDAMGSTGKIKAVVTDEANYVNIEISDTGSGIPASKFKTVFQPGYSTKKRGWGLGLSLAKRIIEDYHSGRIFVKKSSEVEGTTFTIKLPKGQ